MDEELTQKLESSSSASGVGDQVRKPADGPISTTVSQTELVARVAQAPAIVDGPTSIPVPPRGRSSQRVANTPITTDKVVLKEDPQSEDPVKEPVSAEVSATTENPATGNIQRYVVFTPVWPLSV